jgi:choline dehydrogenase-like flavoprotein
MKKEADVLIVGSGIGGGAVARRLAENGIDVTIVERGDWLVREPENWDVGTVFVDKKYVGKDTWLDAAGRPFQPNIYYNVGGCTKFYGAALIRYRERDFEELEHFEGVSPSWPISYADLEPYYCEAEALFGVHGDDTGDRTAPGRSQPYPYPAIPSEPVVREMVDKMRANGVPTSALPTGLNLGPQGNCVVCKTCDGFPCKIGAKNDAETCLIEPALETGRVTLLTRTLVRRLILSADGKQVSGVEVEHEGTVRTLTAKLVIVACGAINTAALLLRSKTDAAPNGVANSSGVVGRNYMCHNQTGLVGLSLRRNDTQFQKTLALNDFYFGEPGFDYPMGHAQMLGKLQAPMFTVNVPGLPNFMAEWMAGHSMDWIAFSEDLPDPENRITLEGERIRLKVKPNNLKVHRRLVTRLSSILKRSGYPIVLTKPLVRHSTSHQCGTVKYGLDPATSALDPYCRSFDHSNLFVIDASFMPSSAAVNPVLTITAQALRSADHILREEFGVEPETGSRTRYPFDRTRPASGAVAAAPPHHQREYSATA